MQYNLFSKEKPKKTWDSWEVAQCTLCSGNVRIDGAMKAQDGSFSHQMCPPKQGAA